jgi:hypothetical protein
MAAILVYVHRAASEGWQPFYIKNNENWMRTTVVSLLRKIYSHFQQQIGLFRRPIRYFI